MPFEFHEQLISKELAMLVVEALVPSACFESKFRRLTQTPPQLSTLAFHVTVAAVVASSALPSFWRALT
jgi:hypothetical protein